MTSTRKVVLTQTVTGVPQAGDFRVIDDTLPEPAPGEVLIRHIYLSLDPYQRSAMAGAHMTGRQPLGTDESPRGEVVGQVIQSRNEQFSEGDYVRHFGGWREHSIAAGDSVTLIDRTKAPLSAYLGVLGMPGLTAYASVFELADVQAGQTVLVSAAAGPVGCMVGQLAIQRGATAWGIAGGSEKCELVTQKFGFSGCVDYLAATYSENLTAAAPDGFDMYHDNVGGATLTAALGVLRTYGTVILCGLISQYNDAQKGVGFNIGPAILKRAVMKGLVVYDFEHKRQEFFEMAAPLVQSGKIRFHEDRAIGIESAGAHFSRLMSGKNIGKALVVISDE